jgi:hypothetical protein
MSAALKQILAEGRNYEFSAETQDEVHRNLLALEESAIASPDPFLVLRLSILEFTEMWKVAELIDDIRVTDEDDAMLAGRMEEIVSSRYVSLMRRIRTSRSSSDRRRPAPAQRRERFR